MKREFYKFKSEKRRQLFFEIEQTLIRILDIDSLPDNIYWKYRKGYDDASVKAYAKEIGLDPYEIMLAELVRNERYLRSIVDTKEFESLYLCSSYIYTIIINKIKEQYKLLMYRESERKRRDKESERLLSMDIEDKSTKTKYKKEDKKISPNLQKYWE